MGRLARWGAWLGGSGGGRVDRVGRPAPPGDGRWGEGAGLGALLGLLAALPAPWAAQMVPGRRGVAGETSSERPPGRARPM